MRHALRNSVYALILTVVAGAASAGVSISQYPVFTSSSPPYAPNMMVLLDNSTSMIMEVMPANDYGQPYQYGDGGTGNQVGLFSPACNQLYFNPNSGGAGPDNAYPLPYLPDGSGNQFPQPSFSSAPIDGFAAYLSRSVTPQYSHWGLNYINWANYQAGTLATLAAQYQPGTYNPNLRVDLTTYNLSLIAIPSGYQTLPQSLGAGYYAWTPLTAGQAPNLPYDCTTAAAPVFAQDGVTPLSPPYQWQTTVVSNNRVYGHFGGTFTWVPIATQSTSVKNAYARWFSFYRSRINTMKSVLGGALHGIADNSLNAGLLTSTTTPVDATNTTVPGEGTGGRVSTYAFMPVTPLDSTGQQTFLNKVYSQIIPNNSLTYLTTGLARLGQYYAGLPSTASTIAGGTLTKGMLDSNGQPDPMIAACQRNFSLVVTDGLYNDWLAHLPDAKGNGFGWGTSGGSYFYGDHGSLGTWSWDTPPGVPAYQGPTYGGAPSLGPTNANWVQPFASPQAYKPFDDSYGSFTVSCETSTTGHGLVGGNGTDFLFLSTPSVWQGIWNVATFSVPAAGSTNWGALPPYSSYLWDANGNEVTLGQLQVPAPGYSALMQQYYPGTLGEYWYGGSSQAGFGWALASNYTWWPSGVNASQNCSNGNSARNSYAATTPFDCFWGNATVTTASGTTCSGESCQNATVTVTPYASCGYVDVIPAGSALGKLNGFGNSLLSRAGNYFVPNVYGGPSLTCTNTTGVSYQIVCSSQLPGQTQVYFRVPNYTHTQDGNGNWTPIVYSYSRSTARSQAVVANPPNGWAGSLSDVAMYYYENDLRPNMPNDLQPAPIGTSELYDTRTAQHMVTYTMGLGTSGFLNYNSNYMDNAPTFTGPNCDDFCKIVQGTYQWPYNNQGTNQYTTGDWHADDMWHTAVNGRGRYFSAANPAQAAAGIASVVGLVGKFNTDYGNAPTAKDTSFSGTGGTTTLYYTQYWPTHWVGDLVSQQATVNVTSATPVVVSSANSVSAGAQLRSRIVYDASSGLWCDDRTLKVMVGSASYDLKWNTPTKSGATCSAGSAGSALPAAATGSVNLQAALSGTAFNQGLDAGALVNWVRGSRLNEAGSGTTATQSFRSRVDSTNVFQPLGDMVNAQPVYVGKVSMGYMDSGYSSFAGSRPRTGRLYVPANDGFLHSFDPVTLQEIWAVMPSSVAAQLAVESLPSYSSGHQFMLDGTPQTGDVYSSADGTWHTILVGGMRAGGAVSGTSGYYALDVTSPGSTPVPLWEFRRNASASDCPNSDSTGDFNPAPGVFENCQLGLTFGAPIITKLSTGQWVVIVASGYNNRDGKGHVFIRDAITGASVARIDVANCNSCTGKHSGAPEVGLAQLREVVVDVFSNNQLVTLYGGDLNGNVWRFDMRTPTSASTMNPTLMATLTDPNGGSQPITTRPVVWTLGNGQPIVAIGTGQMLGTPDFATTQVQSLYGLLEGARAGSDGLAPLTRSTLAAYTTSGCTGGFGVCTNQSSRGSGTSGGFVVDLTGTYTAGGNTTPAAERVVQDPLMVGGVLGVLGFAPSNDPCLPGGQAWAYTFDVVAGKLIASASTRTAVTASPTGINMFTVNGTPIVQYGTGNDATGNVSNQSQNKPVTTFTGVRAAWHSLDQ